MFLCVPNKIMGSNPGPVSYNRSGVTLSSAVVYDVKESWNKTTGSGIIPPAAFRDLLHICLKELVLGSWNPE